jgi:hypothetical protein
VLPVTKRSGALKKHFLCTGVVGSKLALPLIQIKNSNSALFNWMEEYSTSSPHDILKVSKKLIITCLLSGLNLTVVLWVGLVLGFWWGFD